MALSPLQKYILKRGLEDSRNTVSKPVLKSFYLNRKNRPQAADQLDIITKSVDRLIRRGLLKGIGVKTAGKWFIAEVVLTKAGIAKAKGLFGRQAELPLKIKKIKNKSPKS